MFMTFFATNFDIFRSTEVQGSIAIDDITFVNCDFPKPQLTCDVYESKCDRGSCVPNYRVSAFYVCYFRGGPGNL